jgi:hypothetical protein
MLLGAGVPSADCAVAVMPVNVCSQPEMPILETNRDAQRIVLIECFRETGERMIGFICTDRTDILML